MNKSELAARVASEGVVGYASSNGDAIVSSTDVICARCRVSIPVRSDADLDSAISAHQERCVIVGDWVLVANRSRLSGTEWLLAADPMFSWGNVGILCIQRTAPVLSPHAFIRGAESGPERMGPPEETCAVCRCEPRNRIHHPAEPRNQHLATTMPAAPAPAPVLHDGLYDGLTSLFCFAHWIRNRWLVEHGHAPEHAMTPAQICEAKRVNGVVARGTWSPQLRAKVEASAAAGRMRVVVDQDAEVGPWR